MDAEKQTGMDVGDAILRRRSIRRFDRARPVPRELLVQVLDAGRWAPSSCNLQTWDYVVVEDDALKAKLAEETKSVLVAPVSVFVLYDRELAREGQSNVQGASASVMAMLLKATSLGLASLWVTAVGERARVRELLGAPDDFEVLALVCFGWPRDGEPPPPPERRPIDDVVHWNRYGGSGGMPKSPDPDDWSLDDLALYFKRKLQSGTRYNKPDLAFFGPVLDAVRRGLDPVAMAGSRGPEFHLLDVLPGTGILTEMLHRAYPAARLAVLDASAECHFFAERRAGGKLGFVPWPDERKEALLQQCAPPGTPVQIARESGGLPVMPRVLPHPEIAEGPFDAATILFRLEGIPRALRPRLIDAVVARLRPGGRLVIAFTSTRSWHAPAYALRRRLGRDSVEYAPVPEANFIGPYEALSPAEVRRLADRPDLAPAGETRLFPLPDRAKLLGRTEREGGLVRIAGRAVGAAAWALKPFEPLLRPLGRVRIACFARR